MEASRTHPRHTARRFAGLGALALAALATAAAPASAGPARTAQRHTAKMVVFKLYAVTPARCSPSRPRRPQPATGSTSPTSTTGAITTITPSAGRCPTTRSAPSARRPALRPQCYGQAAIGGGQLLLFTTPGGAGNGGKTVVSGGTGRSADATGTVEMSEIGETNNSDIVVTVRLAG